MTPESFTSCGAIALATIPADIDPAGSVSFARWQLALVRHEPDNALAALEHAPAWVLNGWEHSGQPDVLHVRICTEFQAVETHCDPAFDRSAKCQRKKIRYDQPTVVDTKAASAG